MRVIWQEIVALFVLAIPVACVARTIVFEEVFREPREFCQNRSKICRTLLARKFFYLFTCEYCFSHWITLGLMLMTNYHLLYGDWRGSVIGFFSIVFVANTYLNLYAGLRIDLTSEKTEIKAKEKQIEAIDASLPDSPQESDKRALPTAKEVAHRAPRGVDGNDGASPAVPVAARPT